MYNLSNLITLIPNTGDKGINPLILFLLLLCAAIVVGCIVWTIVLNKKNPSNTINVISVEDEAEPEQTTVVEDIEETTDKQ